MQSATYALKENTKSSYYWQQGCRILPNRLSISSGAEMSHTQHKGRNAIHQIFGQLIGQFTRAEESPLKRYKPYVARTQLWIEPTHPQYCYGTIGTSNPLGRVQDTGSLVILSSTDWDRITIYYFEGMGNPAGLQVAMEFLDKKEGAGFTAHTSYGF